MALSIKNKRVERLAAEVAGMTGETKTEAIARALEDRKNRLADKASANKDRTSKIMDYLEREVWPNIPTEVLGKRITKLEREEILGMEPDGMPND